MKIKLLFQGDSITDAGRIYSDPTNLGYGYAMYAARYLQEAYPQVEFEFINLGISESKISDLVARLESDFLAVQPDIVSILIGVNDVMHPGDDRDLNGAFEARYRTILEALKGKAKIMMLEPFLTPVPTVAHYREGVNDKILIERKLAREYADVYLPTDGLLASAFAGDRFEDYSADGVHLIEKGAQYVGRCYCEYMKKIIDPMLN